MPIIRRPATCLDIERGMSIQPNNRGDALVGGEAAVACWRLRPQSTTTQQIAL
jgi:hypothetical protein